MTDGFEKTFEKLTHTQDPTRIFDEFLDYCIDINLFTLKKQELDFHGREEQYMDMFQEWIFLTNEKLSQGDTIGWYDYLGEFYESVIFTLKEKNELLRQFINKGRRLSVKELMDNANENELLKKKIRGLEKENKELRKELNKYKIVILQFVGLLAENGIMESSVKEEVDELLEELGGDGV